MKKRICFFVSLMVFLSLQAFAISVAPRNLDLARRAVVQYVQSGQYMKGMDAQYAKATQDLQAALAMNAKETHKHRLAIVFDIDETSLSNLPYMMKHHFNKNFKKEDVYFQKSLDPAIAPALKFYRFARKNKVAVFFITGRGENLRQATERNLKKVGYKNWVKLFMTPKGYYQANHSAEPFKIPMRKKITEMGYTIAVNVGDQYSDLMGGYAEYAVKLPDPFYFIP